MDVGVATRSFSHMSHCETAEFIAKHGFRWIELCFTQTDTPYWVYNGRGDIERLTPAKVTSVVEEYRSRGIEVASLGVFTNLIATDDTERMANLDYFERMMRMASEQGIRVVASECGFDPLHRGIRADDFEGAFARLVNSLQRITKIAEQYALEVALEPCVLDVVPSAKRMKDLIAQVGSPRLRVLLDPANLIANNTEEEMFAHLAPYVAYFHGKDRKVNDAYGRVVGDGDIDWKRFLALYALYTPDVPFILEYVQADNCVAVRDRVLAYAGSD